MAVRPRSPYTYTADHGGDFNMSIPDDEGTDTHNGWTAATSGAGMGSKSCTPRHVDGVSTGGDHRRLIIATTACDYWTGVTKTFSVAGVTYNIIGYVGEKRTVVA